MVHFACAKCGVLLDAPDHYAGRKTVCSRCGAEAQVPEISAAEGGIRWLSISPEGQAEDVPTTVHVPTPEKPPDAPLPPIDFSAIVRRILRPYAAREPVLFPDDLAEGKGACPERPDEPLLAFFDCRRRGDSRTCLAFTPTGLRACNCRESAGPRVVFVPWAALPGRRIDYGKLLTEIALGDDVIDAWGCTVPVPTLLGVLKQISAEVEREQKTRGEYVEPEWRRLEQAEDVCPSCGAPDAQRTLGSDLPDYILDAADLFGAIGGFTRAAIGSLNQGDPHYRCRKCGCEWSVHRR